MRNKKILGAIVRGALKSVPIGGVAVEAFNNIKHELRYGDIKEKPHNWLSIIIQLIITASIVYAFVTHRIEVDELIRLLLGVN